MVQMRAGLEAEASMSDTDKTRPWWVKIKDYPVHFPRREDDSFFGGQWWVGEMRCGCRLCSDYYGRKQDRRRERYTARAQIKRGWLDYYEE